jgi:glycerol-3-phosphate dehydrogenase
LDGVKRRARPGAGRCQGGFCAPKVMEILAREQEIDITEVVKDSRDSYILTGKTK